MSRAIDIDRAVREARAESKFVDYVKHPDRLPVRPFGWQVVLQPLKPKTVSSGGIVVPESAQEAAEVQITVATVLAVGPLAFTGVSKAGCDMSKFSPDYASAKDLIGKLVLYQRYTGLPVKLKSGDKLLIMDDINIIGDAPFADELLFYYD